MEQPKMSIEYLPNPRFRGGKLVPAEAGILLAVLPKEPQLRRELETINDTISNDGDYDVVIDFTRVEVLTSSSISNLVILHNLLCEHGRQLILCSVSLPTKGLFNVVGLADLFSFAEDKFAALARLQRSQPGSRMPEHQDIRPPHDNAQP
jgi:anti-anti-sigma regulatory factor